MIQFKFQDHRVDIRCQNMNCGKLLSRDAFWQWAWKGENFCSYKCMKDRKSAWKLRWMFNRDWACRIRTYKYKLNRMFNPLEWLKRW